MTTITILGLGEAGRLYARGLGRAGASVRGYDPFQKVDDAEIAQVDDLEDALAGADAVLSLVGARAAVEVAAQALPLVPRAAVYADLNTAAPEAKAEVEALAARVGVPMVDVAVMAPVPRAGHRTALLAGGGGAEQLAQVLGPLQVPVEVVPGGVGAAARLKLLRSVFMKGLATLMIEGLGAAREVGAEEWLRDQMAQELGPDGAALVDRLVSGTYAHAERREHEVRDALAALESAGQPADMTRATLAWFERILAERG
ncbi:DUF1932 domain-containing protein [Microbacterium sp. LRZ72]|uniref:DUF1932 domain-containing protein n=1 Tax=Microbacterium sp. LRZ72 TaxID=2942481 RepID=UPI0029A1AE13|nr:DUF1932 domain-containing protein [Microbacterium sp. LRZ72]MDX2376941.1 DUF1932 domain-containing protein [Microbacterium sp. LRZ72]